MNKNISGLIIASLIFYIVVSVSNVSALTISDVSVSPNAVSSGESVSVSIDLTNNLNDDVKNVEVSLELTSLPFSPEKTSNAFFDEIRSDKSKEASFALIADSDAAEGVYKIPVNIVYTVDVNDSKPTTQKSVISITINSEPKLDLTSESFLIAGQKGTVNLKITNSGLGKAKFLNVKIGSGNYQILSADEIYIGDLNSDDFDTFSFDAYASSPGTISIPLEISYKDFSNNDYQETLNANVRVYSVEEAVSNGLIKKSNIGTYVILVIVLIVLWIVYSRLKKWMKKRKNNNGGK